MVVYDVVRLGMGDFSKKSSRKCQEKDGVKSYFRE